MIFNEKQDLYELAARDLERGAGAVTINRDALKALKPSDKPLTLMGAGLQAHPVSARLEDVASYILVLNALNWMFWDLSSDGKKTFSRYVFDGAVGAVGMRKAFMRAWGNDASSATLASGLQSQGVKGLFGDIPLPLLREQCLIDVLGPNLTEVAKAISQDATTRGKLTFEHAVLIQQAFPVAYRDVYLKRAQLALAEIAGHLAEIGSPVMLDVTAFADYQVPRVLRGIGVLEYSAPLAQRVAHYELVPEGSLMERAIRGATILACKEMAEKLGTTDAAIDNYLWTMRNAVGDTPFHLTVTTDY